MKAHFVLLFFLCGGLVACSPIPQKTPESGESMASKAAKDSRTALAAEDSGVIYATSARGEEPAVEVEQPRKPILVLLPGGMLQYGEQTFTMEELGSHVRGKDSVEFSIASDLPYSDLIVLMDRLRAEGVTEYQLIVRESVE